MGRVADALIVDIERRFPSGAAVSAKFDLTMRRGTIAVLFGPSGAGKTTVVRAIAGLDRPDRGLIRVRGSVWFDGRGAWVPSQERRIGYVSQEPALFPHLTIGANVGYGLRAGDGRERRVDEMLRLFDLVSLRHRRPHELSGGQAQRVALARALAPAPHLLLLDEPFGALDAPTRSRLRAELRAVVRRLEIFAILVTHDRTEAIAIGDDLIVIAEGGVRQVGPVLDVFRRPADLVVARTVGVESIVPASVQRVDNGMVELMVGGAALRGVDPGDVDAREVFACIRAEDVTLQRAVSAGTSARNHLAGRIVGIDPEGPLERVAIDCGFPLVALITRQARQEMGLTEGAPIVAAIKATAVHLVARPSE